MGKKKPPPPGPDRHLASQQYELVALERLQLHPRNPRQGDVGAIHQSVQAHGFYGAVIAQRSTGHILAGNHRYQAAAHAGLDQVPVLWIDCDDDTATRILLADNRMAQMASWDFAELSDLLQELAPAGLEGLGWDVDDLDGLLGLAGGAGGSAEPGDEGGEGEGGGEGEPAGQAGDEEGGEEEVGDFAVAIACNDEEHQLATYQDLVAMGYACKLVRV